MSRRLDFLRRHYDAGRDWADACRQWRDRLQSRADEGDLQALANLGEAQQKVKEAELDAAWREVQLREVEEGGRDE